MPRLAYVRTAPPLPESPTKLAEGADFGERAPPPPPVAYEASILWFGVEILLELSGGSPTGASAAFVGGSPVSGCSEVGSGSLPIVTGARTDCAWACAQTTISVAARHASGGTIEVFLDALAGAWAVSQATGGACEAECAAASATMGFRSAGLGLWSPESPTGVARASSSLAARSSCHSSQRSSTTLPQHRVSSPCESFRGSEHELASECEVSGDGDNDFACWLMDRPPLWRFEHDSQGLAWDFPLSKSEKKELLLLQLFAEERERKAKAQMASCSPSVDGRRAPQQCSPMH